MRRSFCFFLLTDVFVPLLAFHPSFFVRGAANSMTIWLLLLLLLVMLVVLLLLTAGCVTASLVFF
jgi:hypothetical protein